MRSRLRWAVTSYAVLGSAWVAGGSVLADRLPTGLWLEVSKGVGFVLLTSLGLTAVLRRWEQGRREADDRVRRLIESSGEVLWHLRLRPSPSIERVSDGVHALLGIPSGEPFTFALALRCIHPLDRVMVQDLADDPEPRSMRLRAQGWDGRLVHLELTTNPFLDRRGQVVAIDVRARDITAAVRDRAEIEFRDAVSAWQEAGTPLIELLEMACDHLLDDFDIELAWIGWKRPDGRVDVLASGGNGAYLDGLELRWFGGDYAAGPTGQAIREGRPVATLPSDEATLPWRRRALQFGFSATLALPLFAKGDVIGAMHVYARFGAPFDGDTVERFERIAQIFGGLLDRVDDLAHLTRNDAYSSAVGRARLTAPDRDHVVAVVAIGRLGAVRRSAGFAAAEAAYAQVAARIVEAAPEDAEVVRTGDDEITVLIPHEAVGALDRLAQVLGRAVDVPGGELALPFAIGAAHLGPDEDHDVAFRRAVSAAFSTFERLPNTIAWAADELASSERQLATLRALREAIDSGRFEVWYQPQVDARSGRVLSAEALVRWRLGDGSLVLPAEFLPLAEQDGCIVEIGRQVLERALEDAKVFRQLGLGRVCVNASVRELLSPGYVDHIAGLLQRHGVPPSALEVEVVESSELSTEVAAVLARLQAMGVRTSVDDYGTGWSSMAHLAQFSFDTLKIDRSFVRDLIVDARLRSLIEATVVLGTSLDMTLVAEGVEDVDQADFLRHAGCDLLQGYAISPPTPALEMCDFLGDWVWPGATPAGSTS